jgi:hypothetical protein
MPQVFLGVCVCPTLKCNVYSLPEGWSPSCQQDPDRIFTSHSSLTAHSVDAMYGRESALCDLYVPSHKIVALPKNFCSQTGVSTLSHYLLRELPFRRALLFTKPVSRNT